MLRRVVLALRSRWWMCLFSRIFCTCYLLLYEFPGGPRKKKERKRCNCYLPQDLNSCRQPATTCEIFLSFRNNGTKHLSALGSTHHDLSASSQHPQSLVQPSFILNTAARTSNVYYICSTIRGLFWGYIAKASDTKQLFFFNFSWFLEAIYAIEFFTK